MKKIAFIFLSLFLCAILTIGAGAEEIPTEETEAVTEVTEAVTEEQIAWKVYIEEKVVPAVVLALTAICSVYIAISPILMRVKLASDKFKSATEDVTIATKKTQENEKTVTALKTDLETRISELEQSIFAVNTSITNVEKILRIGFGNTEELVRKGYAREIAKVGNDEAKKT